MNVNGNVEIFGTDGLKMKTGNGWVTVNIAPGAKVQYSNKATIDFLKAGVAVEFTAEVDAKHNVKNAVKQLTVVSLTTDRGAGLFPEGSSQPKAAVANNAGRAVGFQVPNAAAADKATKEKAAPRKAAAVQLPATCVVRGTIMSLKDGKIAMKIGHGTVKAEVDDSAEIKVDMTELKFARKGDSVSVKGRGAKGAVVAESVTVQGAEPLTGRKKAKAHGPAKKDKDPLADAKHA
jgi:hypothetical protein